EYLLSLAAGNRAKAWKAEEREQISGTGVSAALKNSVGRFVQVQLVRDEEPRYFMVKSVEEDWICGVETFDRVIGKGEHWFGVNAVEWVCLGNSDIAIAEAYRSEG